ncbi:NADH-quinone oxidoreductase subunit J [Buchnera aphidicola (Taiwanaphis decaspermi)]|uniref:NADH-quinone oxidoreductase subunit J n=1 Tax=Buchnera aphidicola TaxID=9 RepID=UPI0031B7F68D
MNFIFYFCSLIAILTTFLTIFQKKLINSLLFFLISLIATSGIFFSLGSYFSGSLEIIIYAGAIMILFVFVIMMLNIEQKKIIKKKFFEKIKKYVLPSLISLILLIFFVCIIRKSLNNEQILFNKFDIKNVGEKLFGPYILLVELSSLLILSALIIAIHFIHHEEKVR